MTSWSPADQYYLDVGSYFYDKTDINWYINFFIVIVQEKMLMMTYFYLRLKLFYKNH